MSHLVLIACAAKKASSKVKARDLYQSALFQKSLAYADLLRPDTIYILSAKHGLVPAETLIDPYDESLNAKSAVEIREWADAVLRDLARVADLQKDRFTILAGDKYRRYLMPALPNAEVPLEGLGIGRQLQRLDQLSNQLRQS